MKNKISKLFLVFTFLIVGLGFINNNSNVFAAEVSDNLHKQTKIYGSNCDDYYTNCEEYDDYIGISPVITVLTHGLGSQYYYWSNDASINEGNSFAFNSNSIINDMFNKLNGEMNLYIANVSTGENSEGLDLTKYSYEQYINNSDGSTTEIIDDISKHIVVVFNSNAPNSGNYEIYDEFHYVLDTISSQYKSLAGVLPRFNLVGHSRGGITNIMYATEHPYNVDSIFSMGTPYSGSVLGEIDPVLAILNDYVDTDFNIINDGVRSILDEVEMKGIRDAWNTAYTADVNINVVALGSMSSLTLIEALLDDIKDNKEIYGEKYGSVIEDYEVLIETIIYFLDKNPDVLPTTLNFVGDIAEVFNHFDIDVVDYICTEIDERLEGKVTCDEVNNLIDLINVVNGELVLMDDLFIDLNSQLGYGFEDDKSYNGFKRYVKIFTAEDYDNNRAIPTQPGVVHNLEIMNNTLINTIVDSLILASPNQKLTTIYDDMNASYTIANSKTLYFECDGTGTRMVSCDGCEVNIYKFNDFGCLELEGNGVSNLTNLFEYNEKYLITINNDFLSSNVNFGFRLIESLSLGDIATYRLESQDYYKVKVSVVDSGYYYVSLGDTDVLIENITKIANGKYYVYLNKDNPMYIYIKNPTVNSKNFSVSLLEPGIQEINNSININSNNKVMKFRNDYDISTTYDLTLNSSYGGRYANIFDMDNNTNLATQISDGTNKKYTFTLEPGETCYIIYSNTDSTITSNLYVNSKQLRWMIKDEIQDSNYITLPRGNDYSIKLVALTSDGFVEYYTPYVNAPDDEIYTFTGNKLTIKDNATVGYPIIIYPQLSPEFLLSVKVGIKHQDFDWSIDNGDDIKLNFTPNCSMEEYHFTIFNGETTYPLSTSSVSFNLNSYILNKTGNMIITLNKVIVNGLTFYNNTDFLNVANQKVNNLYLTGDGTSPSPYYISCYRHLDNIRKNTSSYYYIFSDIDLKDKTWTPIGYFYGDIYGFDHCINNMKIKVTTDGGDYGFINYLYGTISDLNFNNTTIETSGLDSADVVMYIGPVVGCCRSDGVIEDCDVSNSLIDVRLFKGYVGGIVGKNQGTVSYCSNDNAEMNVSGYAGGICGVNEGTITSCYAYSLDLTYYYKTDNGRIGGVVGYNAGSLKYCGAPYGMIYWNSDSKSRDIKPAMGTLIGYNSGSYENCYSGLGYDIDYYYWKFIGWYDQSEYCFKKDNGQVGRE